MDSEQFGLFSWAHEHCRCQSFVAVVFGVSTMLAVAVSYVCLFENRYDAVVIGSIGRSENRNIYRVIYFIINIIILESMLGYIFWKVPELVKTRIAERLLCLPKEFFENPNLININSGFTIIPYLALSIMCVLFFQGVYFLLYTIYHLFKDTVYVSKSTRKMQQKFFISLFLQAIIPSFALAAPMYCYYILFRMDYFYQVYNNFLMIAIGCNGLLTTLVMILVHRPYRISVLEMCGIGKKAEQQSIIEVTLLKMRAVGVVSGG
ncbi:Protein CBG09143 [Caenorhabditis briggsae]|uniref:Protein CBG09143 n=1 Tax=Caenorhabditis briggsae TaxID=6238 RepID=A8X864_CAEBR|nr:Protein CBG09143 [Caenorhabditis briggsae]CAP28825.2 Protein CBG09143 [Caenorhabditis briggsae]